MAQREQRGTRDLTYSAWHRTDSLKRFVGYECAQRLTMIDVDIPLYLECDDGTYEPLCLVETERDTNQPRKVATITMRLAMRADLHAFTVLYSVSDRLNPADPRFADIDAFRIQRLWPDPEPGVEWHRLSPDQYAQWLVYLRGEIAVHVKPRSRYAPPEEPRWSATRHVKAEFPATKWEELPPRCYPFKQRR